MATQLNVAQLFLCPSFVDADRLLGKIALLRQRFYGLATTAALRDRGHEIHFIHFDTSATLTAGC